MRSFSVFLTNPILSLHCLLLSYRVHQGLKQDEFLKQISYAKANRRYNFDSSELQKVFVLVRMFGNRLFKGHNCKLTSLVMFNFAKQSALLHISTDNQDKQLSAHSWVEQDNYIFSEQNNFKPELILKTYKKQYDH